MLVLVLVLVLDGASLSFTSFAATVTGQDEADTAQAHECGIEHEHEHEHDIPMGPERLRAMRANAIHDGGFHLTGTSVWLDPRRHAEFGIVSDALGEARPARAVTTPTTALLLRRRGGGASVVAAPVHRPFSVGDVDVELVPSGAMPGGAQVLLRRRGATILYLRRVLPEPLGAAEPLESPRADAVLVDAPGGFPPEACSRRAETVAAMVSWAERAMGRNEIPVILAEPVAVAPVLVGALGPLGCEIRLHRAVHLSIRALAGTGVAFAKAWPLVGQPRLGQIVILPHALGTAAALERIPGRAVAIVHDGATALPDVLRSAESFLLAAAAGIPELLAHVQRTGASEVHLSPETPAALGAVLHDLGVATVVRAGPPEQIPLGA